MPSFAHAFPIPIYNSRLPITYGIPFTNETETTMKAYHTNIDENVLKFLSTCVYICVLWFLLESESNIFFAYETLNETVLVYVLSCCSTDRSYQILFWMKVEPLQRVETILKTPWRCWPISWSDCQVRQWSQSGSDCRRQRTHRLDTIHIHRCPTRTVSTKRVSAWESSWECIALWWLGPNRGMWKKSQIYEAEMRALLQ